MDLATNLGGTANVEGPLWWKEGGYLLFRGTDLKRWKYAPGQACRSSRRTPTPRTGSPATCRAGWSPARRRPAASCGRSTDGSITVLANSFQGRRLNFPNDIVVKSDGAIYFTDPWTGPPRRCRPGETDPSFAGVFRVSPDRGTLTLLVNDFLTPEWDRVLARRERALHQRHGTPPHPRLRSRSRTARSPARPTACLPTWADPSPASPTA